ncbi:RNA polymerase sigma factor [Actinokineospora terrae]|uniref:RNA polymerase sigma-70 factor, ECF subfamily n=1 Tax=Actinokineospora terrae TaxID=155974 RepID=A0A1H9N637_9PSEU|nr:sigma-70 family RNA polymerase sigma factor [Actinokineospora terrae]SER31358.1 RNA polymerase sigma-70 factor, ECF subfamily [Actinokineospora terrae]
MSPRIPDEAAKEVAELFRYTARDLHRYAFRLNRGDAASAEDQVQDAFQAAALAWPALRPLSAGRRRAWLFAVVRNKSIDTWRKSTGVESLTETGISTAPEDTHYRAVHLILLERCWKLLLTMPTARFRVAYLRWHESMSTREIADHLGIAPSTVRVHIKHARDEIIANIGPDVPFLVESERPIARSERKEVEQ